MNCVSSGTRRHGSRKEELSVRLEGFTAMSIFPCGRKLLKVLTSRINYLSKCRYLYKKDIVKNILLSDLPHLINFLFPLLCYIQPKT